MGGALNIWEARFITAALGWLLAIGAANAIAAEDAGSEIDAKAVLQKNGPAEFPYLQDQDAKALVSKSFPYLMLHNLD